MSEERLVTPELKGFVERLVAMILVASRSPDFDSEEAGAADARHLAVRERFEGCWLYGL
jgi:hypothetical protein